MQSLLIVYIVFVLSIYLLYTKESYETKVDKTKCRKMAHRKLWSTYDWTSRVMNKGAWKCPSGWQNTGCTWEMGNEFEKKQCRRKKSETTSEDKNTKRSDQTKLLRAGIHAQTVAIVSQGGTIKGSTRFNSKNVTDEQLAQRLADLKKQFKELKKNKSGPQPAAAEGQSAAAVTTRDAAAPAAAPVSSASIESKITNIVKSELASSCRDVSSHYRNDIEKTESLVETVLDTVGNDVFVIVTWTGQGGDATGYATKIHIECLTNPTTKSTRGYDIYIWAPGATGQFVHRNGPGFGNWRMTGGKFQESWRSGTDGSIVTINN